MNHVIAQGSPNSIIRHFQENPNHGVELLDIVKRLNASIVDDSAMSDAANIIAKIERRHFAKVEGR